jgi:hypothetical protein
MEARMNQEQSIALWQQGKEAWNAWANSMLQRKKNLRSQDIWKTTHAYFVELEQGDSEEAKIWFAEARADFSGTTLLPAEGELRINFEGFIFPGAVSFARAKFRGNAWFWHADFQHFASFEQAEFGGLASFGGAFFHEIASFLGTVFNQATYTQTKFLRRSEFTGARFEGQVDFKASQFRGDAWFNGTQFQGLALFDDARFLGAAHFDEGARFKASARFLQVNFEGYTSFHTSHFEREADFTAIKVERALNLTGAMFAIMPNFDQADFKQSPNLDGIDFPLPSRWPRKKGGMSLIPKYRHVRRLAIQGHDYEREQMAFKGELRSRRGYVDYKFGLGFWYDLIADCGRSIWRPFLTWLVFLVAFTFAYLSNAGVPVSTWNDACQNVVHTPKWLKALSLSISNAVPVIGSSRVEEIRAIYGCLYGSSHVSQGGAAQFDISGWSLILQTGQNVVSAALIFLVLLAIRNQFKIK